MDVELRHLRCLIAIVESGSFTDAAVALGISQPAVSRTLAALENALGVRLLRRTSRVLVLTAEGTRVLSHARHVVAAVEDLVRDARPGAGRLRIGHAWAAIGKYTVEFQRRWRERHPDVALHLVRTNSPTGGLAEGACDLAVVRTRPDSPRFASVVVGLEPRYCALPADDPLARRRQLDLDELADRVLAIDRRTGTTSIDLWPVGRRPQVEEVHDVDDWLAVIAGGRCIGVTAESTRSQYARQGVVFRRLRGVAPVAVRAIWWRDEPHPATRDAVGLLAELYGTGRAMAARAPRRR